MAAAPSGRYDNELRWETLIAEAHAAFLQTCSLKLSEPIFHAPNEEFLSVSPSFCVTACAAFIFKLQILTVRVKPAGRCSPRAATHPFTR